MNPASVDDPTVLLSQHDPVGTLCHRAPQQTGASKRPRRNMKSKGGHAGNRNGAVVMRKRKLSEVQASMLEQSFRGEHKLETRRKDRLAAELGMEPRQVAVWFQNRRARWRIEKVVGEYSKLRSAHDAVVHEKRILVTEVMKLKEQVQKAESELQRLSEHPGHGLIRTSYSPKSSSSLSMERTNIVEPPNSFGEFACDYEGSENVFYPEPWTCNNEVDLGWGNPYFM